MSLNLTTAQVLKWTGATILAEHAAQFCGIATDTRHEMSGKIFFALKGDTFDAHDFIDQCVSRGAAAVIIHRLEPRFEYLKEKITIFLVDDTLAALQTLARGYRDTLTAKIIGITGSNGKTSTKEFAATLLQNFKPTHFNKGSFNNHWGVPLTLLDIPPASAFAVIEMGMNHAGEIARLVEIADPDVVVCTMVGRAHIEFFGSVQEIAQAKNEIYLNSKPSAVRIYNQDQDLTFDMMYPAAKKFPAGRMLSFSEKNKEADVYFKLELVGPDGLSLTGQIAGVWGTAVVPVFGAHNIVNLMAASCVAYAVGMHPEFIWNALPQCKSAWGRNEFIKTSKGVELLFDGYNANPDSFAALVQNARTVQTAGRKIAVIGQMKELGDRAAELHAQLGFLIGSEKYDHVFFIGENKEDFKRGLNQSQYGQFTLDQELTEEMRHEFLNFIRPMDFILIKGSRGIKMERFVELCEPLNWWPLKK